MSKINLNEYDEMTPHRKKKKKTVKKSDHKHQFKPFIGIIPADRDKSFHREHYIIAEECIVCQRQRIKQYFISKPCPDNRPFRQMVSRLDEIKELFPNYEVKEYKEEWY